MEHLGKEQRAQLVQALDDLERELIATIDDARASASVVELDQTRVGRVPRGDAMQQQAMAAAGLRGVEPRLQAVRAARQRAAAGNTVTAWNATSPSPLVACSVSPRPPAASPARLRVRLRTGLS